MSDAAGGTIRLLTVSDIPAALQLSVVAGWNQTADDWRLLLDLAPEGCFCIEADGIVAATTTLLCYGRQLAWIGMVLTHTDFRRRGFAKNLLAHALARADALRIETVKLDATEDGQPLYARLGFSPEQPVERWVRPSSHSSGQRQVASHDPSSTWSGVDAEAFGADRSELLRKLQQRGQHLANAGAYLFARPGRHTAYTGPCVATDAVAARELFQVAIDTSVAGAWAWDLLPRNRAASALANDLGFAPQRQLMRMSRGRELRGKEHLIFALAGFELG
jgi:GNAT superfamily N-acetyltransferase